MADVAFYELNESAVVNATNFPAGALICCKDSTNIYMVPTAGAKPVKMSDTTIYSTEAVREALLAPINGKQYFCYDTGKMWIYYNKWVCLNPDIVSEFDIENVVLTSTGSVTVTDSRIKSTHNGTFIPDLSVADLVTGISVSCANGSATITGTTSYDIVGTLKIN